MTTGRVSYCRPLTTCEGDVLKVAGEILHRTYADDISDELDEQMKNWALRLAAAHNELLHSLRVVPTRPRLQDQNEL